MFFMLCIWFRIVCVCWFSMFRFELLILIIIWFLICEMFFRMLLCIGCEIENFGFGMCCFSVCCRLFISCCLFMFFGYFFFGFNVISVLIWLVFLVLELFFGCFSLVIIVDICGNVLISLWMCCDCCCVLVRFVLGFSVVVS